MIPSTVQTGWMLGEQYIVGADARGAAAAVVAVVAVAA
jgi:hypothetical protein